MHQSIIGPARLGICLLALAATGVAGSNSVFGPETRGYSAHVWQMRDGLPHAGVQAIAQTPDGYLWIGTGGGLARFDGLRFSVYDRANTPAFHDDSVLSLHPARDGSLWIGTEGGGLIHYNKGVFRMFGADEGLTNGFVRQILEDRQGRLWIGTDRGLFRLDSGLIRRLDGTDEFPFIGVMTLLEDLSGRIWIGGSDLLVAEDGRLRRYEWANDLGRIMAMHQSRAGAIWVVSAVGVVTLGENGPAGRPAEVPIGVRPSCVYEDSEGNTWLGTIGDGLVRRRSATVETYRAPDPLPDNFVRAIHEDQENNIWLGTQDGLVRLSTKIVSTLTTRHGLANHYVSTIYGDSQGTLWLASRSRTLHRLTEDGLSPFTVPALPEGARVRTLFRDRDGALWFGTDGGGVIRYAGGAAVRFTTRDGLRNDYIRAFHQSADGDLWIGTDSGLSRWNGREFQNYYVEHGLPYGSVRSIAGDANGDVWVGTDGGVGRLRGDKFVTDPILESIGREKVWAIHVDGDGGVWLGTRGGGLFRVRDGRVSRFTTREGLPNNNIYQILEDLEGNFWISGAVGIFRVKRTELDAMASGKLASLTVLPYGMADGLETTHMNGGVQPAGWRADDGALWFPSVRGALRIDPQDVRVTRQPPVLVEAVYADEHEVPLNGSIRVPPGRGNLEIQYTALNLYSPERIQFKYKLEGFDQNWTAVSTRRAAYYTNLPPGDYKFRVMAFDAASSAQPQEASLAFVLAPHFYQAGWFYALCVLMLALAGWAAMRMHARQTESRYAMLLAERGRLAREMHDTVIQSCVGVSTLLEAASSLRSASPPVMSDLVDKARVQVRRTLQEARHAVWDLRQTSFGPGVVDPLSEFAQELSIESRIPIETEVTGSPVPLDQTATRNLLLVAKEAIRNAVAHARPRRVLTRLSFQAHEVTLEVTDDGIGFHPPAEPTFANGHYGLTGMRERVEQVGGRFELESRLGSGTRVTARVPLISRRKALATYEQN